MNSNGTMSQETAQRIRREIEKRADKWYPYWTGDERLSYANTQTYIATGVCVSEQHDAQLLVNGKCGGCGQTAPLPRRVVLNDKVVPVCIMGYSEWAHV